MDEIIKVRKEVSKALELARKDKLIGHSLDASVILGVTEEVRQLLAPYENDLRTLFIVSSASMMPFDELTEGMEGEEVKGVKVKVALSQDTKCERCWVHDSTTGADNSQPTICSRCVDALKGME